MKPFAAALLTIALSAAPQNRDDAERLLKAAQNAELVDGNINGAIKQYGAIIAKFARTDRATAATALVRMADCYRRMGDNESRKIYEQVVREYADQKDAVALARERLGAIPASGRMSSTLVWNADTEEVDSVSQDGRYFTHIDWGGNLVIHEIATGQDRRLTDTGQKKGERQKRYADVGAISPDGRLVAYGWYDEDNGKQYELRIANLAGDPNPHRVYTAAGATWIIPNGWTPDGKSVLVQVSTKNGPDRLGFVSLADGTLSVVKSGDFGDGLNVALAPDGKHIAYAQVQPDRRPQRAIFIVAADGTAETSVAPHRGRNFLFGWSPDGRQLLFASDRSGSNALWSIAIADGKAKGEPQLIKTGLGEAFSIGITRSGALYYGNNRDGSRSAIQLASFDLTTGQGSQPREFSQDYLESNRFPVWSPDGQSLAYISNRLAGPREASPTLVIRSGKAFESAREVQPKLRWLGMPIAWSSDGRSVVAFGDDEGGLGTVRIDVLTGDATLIVHGRTGMPTNPAAVAPDGRTLYVKRKAEGNSKEDAFVLYDIATGAEKEILRRPQLGGLNLSPDGRYIFTASPNLAAGTRTILLVPALGGEPRVMMSVPSDVAPADLMDFKKGQVLQGLSWASDSRSFFVNKGAGSALKGREVWRIPIDGRTPVKMPWTLPEKYPSGAHQPGGSLVAVTTWEQPAKRGTEVWRLDHFLPSSWGAAGQ